MGATFGKQLYTEPYWDVIAVSGVTGVALGLMASASKEVTVNHTIHDFINCLNTLNERTLHTVNYYQLCITPLLNIVCSKDIQ